MKNLTFPTKTFLSVTGFTATVDGDTGSDSGFENKQNNIDIKNKLNII